MPSVRSWWMLPSGAIATCGTRIAASGATVASRNKLPWVLICEVSTIERTATTIMRASTIG